MQTRAAITADILAIRDILIACQAELPPLSEEGLLPLLRRNIQRGSVLLAMCGEKPVGVIIWSPPLSRISLLAVIPNARGKGLASMLMQSALDAMPGADVTLDTFQEGDPRGRAARALYQKFGFLPERLLSGYETPMETLKLRRK